MALNAAQQWWVRAGGNQLNGGGYDATISGAGTNYSDSDTAQVTFNGTTVTAATSGIAAVITITGYTVTGLEIGNICRIASGTNYTTGYYCITNVNTGANTWTFDRNCTTGVGAAMVGRMGGAHASLQSYASNATGLSFPTLTTPLIAGNIVNVRGNNGSPQDYDYSAGTFSFPAGNDTAGRVQFIGYNVRPIHANSGIFDGSNGQHRWSNFKIVVKASAATVDSNVLGTGSYNDYDNIIIDVNGNDMSAFCGNSAAGSHCRYSNIEILNSGSTSAGTKAAIGGTIATITNCTFDNIYIHDVRGNGIQCNVTQGWIFRNCIVANCNGAGGSIIFDATATVTASEIWNCTVDNGAGDGIQINSLKAIFGLTIKNTIISNHRVAGKFGLNITVGNASANDPWIAGKFDYNNFSNNTADRQNANAGAHDLALTPGYGSGGGQFTVGTNMKAVGFPSSISPNATDTATFIDIGATQRQEPSGTGSISVECSNTAMVNPLRINSY